MNRTTSRVDWIDGESQHELFLITSANMILSRYQKFDRPSDFLVIHGSYKYRSRKRDTLAGRLCGFSTNIIR